MVLYLVKWADGTAALIHAMDADDLIELLDEVGDPSAASWQIYDGPLWLEFPKIDSDLPDGDISSYDISIGRPEAAPCDNGGEFENELLAALHPTVAALRHSASGADRSVTREELAAAMEADLDHALPGSVAAHFRRSGR